jgi:transcription antitermination factor NusG
MTDKTIVLKKDGHWYVISSSTGDEREILLTILEYAENRKYNIAKSEVLSLIEKLGYELDVHEDFGLTG